jgi:hypothetical protein
MSLMKFLLFIAIVGAAFHFWNKQDVESALKTATISPNGFIDLPAPTNLDNDLVIVFAAEGCPKEEGQRADHLAEALSRQNIPNTRAHSASFDLADPDPALLGRLDSVMKGTLPIVFVNGKGKANPTLDEVVSEYNIPAP